MTTGGLPQIGFQAVIQGLAAFTSNAHTVNNLIQNVNNSVQKLAFESSTGFERFGAAARVGFVGIASLAATAGSALATVGVIAGKVAADFENSMVQIQVLTGATAKDMGALEDAIFQVGRTTPISMQQAAAGALELGKAGVTVTQQLDGALQAVVDFTIASAGDLGMADAAQTVAKALTTFGLAADQTSRITNSLTAIAQGTALSYRDLNRSFQQSANVAADLHLTVEDLSAALGVLGQAGLRGSDAGTSLKQTFVALLNPSKEAVAKMKEFNISLFDGEGKAKPFRDVLVELETAFGQQAIATGKLTELQKENALAVIFGSDAIRATSAFARLGVKAFDELRAATENVKASKIAELFLLPTSQQLAILKNSLLATAEVLGKAFLESFRGALVQVNAFLLSISKADIENFARNLATLAGGALNAALAFATFAKSVASSLVDLAQNREVVFGLIAALAALTAPVIITGLGLLSAGIASLSTSLAIGAIRFLGFVATIGTAGSFISGVGVALAGLGGALIAVIGPMTLFIITLGLVGTNLFGTRDSIIRLITLLEKDLTVSLINLTGKFSNFGAGVLGFAGSLLASLASLARNIPKFGDAVANALDDAAKNLLGMSKELSNFAKGTEKSANDAATAIIGFGASLTTGKDIIDDAKAKYKELIEALFGVGNEYQRAAIKALGSAFVQKQAAGDILGALKDVAQASKIFNQAKLGEGLSIADIIAKNFADSLAAAKKAWEDAQASLGSSFPTAIEKAKTFLEALGVTIDQTRKFFEALGFTVGDTARFMQLLGITAAEASPIIGDLGLTIAQGVAILEKLGFTSAEATAKVTALAESLKKTKTAFEQTGASISGATKLLTAMGLSTEDIVAKLTGLGVDSLDAAGGLSEIGLNAETATKFLVALGFSTDEAREKLKAISDEALKRSAFEKLKTDVEKLAATIRTDLTAAIGVLNSAFGGGAAAGVVTAGRAVATGALEQLTTQLSKLGQFGASLAGILGDFFTDITTDILQFSTATGTAQSAIEAFSAAATTLPLNAAASIGLMTNAADSLERTMQSLSGTEAQQAEALLKVLRGLIAQAVAAGADATALQSIKDAFDLLAPSLDKIAGNMDAATEAAKKLRASLSVFGFDMASIMEAANSATDTFKKQLELGLIPEFDRLNPKWEAINTQSKAHAEALKNVEKGYVSTITASRDFTDVIAVQIDQLADLVRNFDRVREAQRSGEEERKAIEAKRLVAQAFAAEKNPEILGGVFTSGGAFIEQAINVLGGGFQAAAQLQKLIAEFINAQKEQNAFLATLPETFRASFTQFGFQQGGIVPGPTGRAVPAMVHGGEFIFTPTQVQRLEVSIPRNMVSELANALRGNNNSYVVNASYENVQSPLSIEADLRAMVAITR